jgi:hypothetical protein
MIPKPIRIIGFILYCLFWILIAHFFVGCASIDKVGQDEGWFPNRMCEDAQDNPRNNYHHKMDQDYPTKYNLMDSPDGRGNPNAQANIFRFTY